MAVLKPRRRFRRLLTYFDQTIYAFTENGIGQHALNLVARDRLQDDPGVVCNLPQLRIELPPHFVGGVIPRPMHIQGKFRQTIAALDLSGHYDVFGADDICICLQRGFVPWFQKNLTIIIICFTP